MPTLLVIARKTSLVLFATGMFVFPILFGSASGAVSLVISLIWFLCYAFKKETWTKLPMFMKIWVAAALTFFPLYALTASKPMDIIYAFNQFGFVLAVGVYWFAKENMEHKHIEWLAYAAMLGLIIGAGWAIYQHNVVGVGRVSAYFAGGPNLIARVAVILFLFASVPALNYHNNIRFLAMIAISFLASLVVIFYSESRGTILVIPVLLTSIVLAVIQSKNILRSWKPWLLAISTLLGVIGFGYLVDPNGQFTVSISRVQSLWNNASMDGSTSIRFEMLQLAIAAFENSILFGNGWHSFKAIVMESEISHLAGGPGELNLHSDLANFATAGGLAGVLLYLTFLTAPLITFLANAAGSETMQKGILSWAIILPFHVFLLGITDMVIGFDLLTMQFSFSFAIIYGIYEEI